MEIPTIPQGVNQKEHGMKKGGQSCAQLGVWLVLFFVVAACVKLYISSFSFSPASFMTMEFSVLLTLAAATRCLGFLLLVGHMVRHGSAAGVSLKTLQLYALTFACRLFSILRDQGYLPIDKSGDWLYHAVEMCSLVFVAAAMGAMVAGPLAPSVDADLDAFGTTFGLGAGWCVIPCLALAVLFHPTLNKDVFSDVSWATSMYFEAVAMVPQIFLFHRQIGAAGAAGTTVQPLIAHTVFAVAFSRVFELAFWSGSYHELTDAAGSGWPGVMLLAAQVTHCIVCADFIAVYLFHTLLSQPVHLPAPASASSCVASSV